MNSPNEDVQVAGEGVAKWNDYIPYTPTQIYELFSGGYEANTAVSVHLKPGGSVDFDQKDYGDRFQADMTLQLGNKVRFEKNYIRVKFDKGQKVGTNAMRIQIETAVAMGAPIFEIMASGSNGGYTWFRAGFHMDENAHNFKEKKYETGTRYEARLHAIRDFLTIDDYYEARDLVQLENAEDPMRIANMKATINIEEMRKPRNESRLIRGIEDFYNRHSDEDFSKMPEIEVENISDIFGVAAAKDKETVSLGSFLQVGTILPAVADFRDREQMEQIGTYFGGWKTIEPV